MKQFWILFALLLPSLAGAHESRPLYIQITELNPGVYDLTFKVPGTVSESNTPVIKLDGSATAKGNLVKRKITSGFQGTIVFESTSPINGNIISIRYPGINPAISTIINIRLLKGQTFNTVLGPEVTEWMIPQEEKFADVAYEYTILGVQHILEGWDHLLFLVCLVIVAGTGRKMLITITGFTLAHSVTLILSSLGLVQLPIPPVEAVIALSVVFLATEIALNNENSLTYRYPITVSSSFGLLHGFGFAAVLGEIGLPQTEVVVSLLFFNVGVELGQLIFLVFVMLLLWIGKTAAAAFSLSLQKFRIEQATAYIVGSIASFWMIERVVGFF